jgi:uncharacterized membrane protein YdjX (TVP38/TMEM64 family)
MNEMDRLKVKVVHGRGRRRAMMGHVLGWVAVGALLAWGWWVWEQAAFLAWKAEAPPLPFFAALAVLPAVGVPTTPFYIMAGATFGGVAGVLGSMASLAVNLVICHWIGQSGLRPWLVRRLEGAGRTLPHLEKGKAWRFTALVKLAPGVPAFAKNYLIVLAGVPFPVFFGISMAATLPYVVTLVILGESVREHDVRDLVGVAAGLLALAGVAWWVRRRWVAQG